MLWILHWILHWIRGRGHGWHPRGVSDGQLRRDLEAAVLEYGLLLQGEVSPDQMALFSQVHGSFDVAVVAESVEEVVQRLLRVGLQGGGNVVADVLAAANRFHGVSPEDLVRSTEQLRAELAAEREG